MSVAFDPWDYGLHVDPYPTYARLREEAPAYHNTELGFWALSRHRDVKEAFRDSARFSSADGVTLDPAGTGPRARMAMSFLAMDPPDHERLRGLVSRVFTVRRVAEMEDRVRAITGEHLERALDMEDFDLIGDLAGRIPMDVISEMLGVPVADRAELRRLADVVVHREPGLNDVPPAAMEASLTLVGHYSELLAERRAHPGDDLTSALCTALPDEPLSDTEIIGFLYLMVAAGNETTAKLLGNCWYWGWRVPDQGRRPFESPERIPAWIEETLRFDTSSHLLARTTTVPVSIHGEEILAGSRVVLLPASANRDPRAFPDPDAYDLDRDTSALLSFGHGRHFCLGASLARLEARVVLEELVAHVAGYDVDAEGAERVHSANVLGFTTLPTRIRRR